jgi:hypothetical protein
VYAASGFQAREQPVDGRRSTAVELIDPVATL